jgi:hypothetical protein
MQKNRGVPHWRQAIPLDITMDFQRRPTAFPGENRGWIPRFSRCKPLVD